jgi:uncharacterized protein
MLDKLRRPFLPNKVVLFKPTNGSTEEITEIAASLKDQVTIGGRATAYVCRNKACEQPVTEPQKMIELLHAG